MKSSLLMTALVALLGTSLISGCASHKTAEVGNVSLVGTWLGESNTVTSKWGYGSGTRTLVVVDQHGTEFTGENTFTFRSDKPIPASKLNSTYDASSGIVKASKKIIGTYNPEVGFINIAEVDGGGTFMGKLLDKDTMEITFTEAGEYARVFRVKLTRQGAATRK